MRSPASSASRMPSVMSFTRVFSPTWSVKRTFQPAGLGVPDHPAHSAAQLEADLGDLGGLPGAGLARDDHDLVVADGGGDVLPAGADGELGRVGDGGGASGGDALLG